MGADGQIRFWNIHDGTLTHEFEGTNDPDEGIFCGATNGENTVLVTTDSKGFVAVWDMSHCCVGGRKSSLMKTTQLQDDVGLSQSRKAGEGEKEDEICEEELPLLHEWRAHLQIVVCLDVVEKEQLVITGSTDCSVRLWTVCHSYLFHIRSNHSL
jgi:WD40 repeat protein